MRSRCGVATDANVKHHTDRKSRKAHLFWCSNVCPGAHGGRHWVNTQHQGWLAFNLCAHKHNSTASLVRTSSNSYLPACLEALFDCPTHHLSSVFYKPRWVELQLQACLNQPPHGICWCAAAAALVSGSRAHTKVLPAADQSPSEGIAPMICTAWIMLSCCFAGWISNQIKNWLRSRSLCLTAQCTKSECAIFDWSATRWQLAGLRGSWVYRAGPPQEQL